jgi:hypothetical protein
LRTRIATATPPCLAAAANAGGTADKVQALIDAHANVHAKDNRGLNALELARKRIRYAFRRGHQAA